MLAQARQDKEAMYLELLTSRRCRLVVVATETGGHWSDEAQPSSGSFAREVPHLSSQAGCECVAHILQTLTDLNPGVRFDLQERNVGRPLEDGGGRRSDPPSCADVPRSPVHMFVGGCDSTHPTGGRRARRPPSCPCCLRWGNASPDSSEVGDQMRR